jgi:hypothetical protein
VKQYLGGLVSAQILLNPPREVVNNVKEFFQPDHEGDGQSLTDIMYTEEEIEAAYAELKSTSAAGADGVPASLLKTLQKRA